MEKISILLVDKNHDYLESCINILQVQGNLFQIDTAGSSTECETKLHQSEFDVLLLNYQVQEKDGLKQLHRIKAMKNNLPVILLVDETQEAVAAQALNEGADDYIVKVSGDQTALPFTIRKVVERNRTRPQPAFVPPTEATETEFSQPYQSEPPAQETKSIPPENPDPIYQLDTHGHFLTANAQLVELSGYTEDELLELSVADLLPDEMEHPFHHWLASLVHNGESAAFSSELVTRVGTRIPVKLILKIVKDKTGKVHGYKGWLQKLSGEVRTETQPATQVDQIKMISEIMDSINLSLKEPTSFLLERLAQIASQIFRFQKVTLALLDRKKKVFIKQAIVGYNRIKNSALMEVPEDVIENIFEDPYQLKVMYYSREGLVDFAHTEQEQKLVKRNSPAAASRRFLWHDDDMLILNLVDQNRHTFGYVSLENPLTSADVSPELVHNLELFGKLASMAIENHYHYSMLERRNRRLKQILVTNNIFKLYLNINELMREVVWSVKFSMDFNLVGLALVTRTSGKLELKAVACDDKIKQLQLEEQKFDLAGVAEILKKAKYVQSKSYFITEPESVFQGVKQIYYGLNRQITRRVPWKSEYLILVPIKTRDHKISGFLLLDDPTDGRIPNLDIFRTIEILANQIAIAIDNRTLYSQMKKRVKILEKATGFSTETVDSANENLRIQRLVSKFFK